MRLLYTDTGLNNPLLPVYSLTAAEIALANLNPTIWSPATANFIKTGAGQKISALANRIDGGKFNAQSGLEPSIKLNGSVLQGIDFSGASGMAGDTEVVMDANINTFAFIYQLPSGALPVLGTDKAVIATQENVPHGVGIRTTGAGSFPIFLNGGVEADLPFTPNNMGKSLFCAVVMCSNKNAGAYAIAYQRSDQSAVTTRQVTGYTIPAYTTSQKMNLGGAGDGSVSPLTSVLSDAIVIPGLYSYGTSAQDVIFAYLMERIGKITA
ncbi:TPA: hypothetical protein L7V11_005061 [Klebsiella pneumoniae]|nr:hypothetical protein [Klebsiella pneumoniae]HBQ2734093.1 hypothetical protein [Klebsiella pneumoniae]HBQ2739627.1 hypothetical protein [Klebsiella pneumoniae]HBQ2745088.1 hypothetical protein [Klebsiella pneumoniae]HBQ2750542.1 hypothetical protein [Klebsiella pneumoniae]